MIKLGEGVLNVIYPVGSIYFSINSTNPGQIFGGTWSQIAQGRTLVGVDINDTDFNVAQKFGGSKNHRHITPLSWLENPRAVGVTNDFGMTTRNGSFYGIYSDTSGGLGINMNNYFTDYESNLIPYFTCYIWCRTA